MFDFILQISYYNNENVMTQIIQRQKSSRYLRTSKFHHESPFLYIHCYHDPEAHISDRGVCNQLRVYSDGVV